MRRRTLLLLLVVQMVLSGMAVADTASVTTHVVRVVTSSADGSGGCKAKLDVNIGTEKGIDCGSWVTFACDGSFEQQKDIAYRKLDMAQKSEITGHKAKFNVDDSRKMGIACFAETVQTYGVP